MSDRGRCELVKRWVVLCAALVAGCSSMAPGGKPPALIDVELQTTAGDIDIEVFADKAPASAHAFLALVDDGTLTRYGTFYRAVRKDENDHGNPKIDVIEGGWQNPPTKLPAARHESTRETGLHHLDGTVSLGRSGPEGGAGDDFFICIGDQPSLDIGGGRDPFGDGQGFAAFGRVIKGMEVVRKIHRMPTTGPSSDPYLAGQILDPPVRILKAFRQTHRSFDAALARDRMTQPSALGSTASDGSSCAKRTIDCGRSTSKMPLTSFSRTLGPATLSWMRL